MTDGPEAVATLLDEEFQHMREVWENLKEQYGCIVIQNNYENPPTRLLGNREAFDMRGRVSFIRELNRRMADYASENPKFYIHDIEYLSSCLGLDRWADPFYWHMYKYALAVPLIPDFCFSLSNMIKSLYGKNKKALVLDLDNTLWGGVVGDDGPENLEIGQETSVGQAYTEFQRFLKDYKQIGVLLNVDSKNEYDNAITGIEHPDGVLRQDDFICIKANWDPKDLNFEEIAKELNLLPESLVFVDDNPAEREIVRSSFPGAGVPELEKVEDYPLVIDRSGFFEVTTLSEDDLKRTEMYRANMQRSQEQKRYTDYRDFLRSLEMHGEGGAFQPVYMSRIAQLTNKSNQFNLTTKRYTQAEIEEANADPNRITVYGKLTDKFGDNGVVSVVIGRVEGSVCHIELWIMSCRVLKRDMEYFMLDQLVAECQKRGVSEICGYYYPTLKNGMVKEFYGTLGFTKESEDADGNTCWRFSVRDDYTKKNTVIDTEGGTN